MLRYTEAALFSDLIRTTKITLNFFVLNLGKSLPFYGLQFHPEKTQFEWAKTVDIPHTSEAVRFSQHLIDNFMDEARKNIHSFISDKEERHYLISSRPPIYTGYMIHNHSPFVQIYVF